VLDTDRKGLPGSVPKMDEMVGTGVYMREGTTSKAMGVDRPYGQFYDFYSVSPEYIRYHLIHLKLGDWLRDGSFAVSMVVSH
jgi:hypothetical protein